MSGSTVYDVKVRYALDDKASKPANNLAGSLDRAGRSAFSLRGAIAGLGIAGVFAAGKKTLIDFNSEIDQMRIGMTTIMTMQLKKPWEEASKSADRLFVRFQEMAKKSPATTKDFITMANAITPVVASMGGGEDKIAKLTQGAVIAGIATGTRADVAALDVKQMLLGNVTERDMMANQLLASKGVKKEDFNKMSGAARGAMIESMLSDPALMKAAEEFGKSFSGQVSTFQDQLQIALGTVGKPLMASLTAEVRKWNNWIEKHPQTIAQISKQISGMLVNAFEFISKSVSWLVDNKDQILHMAKIFLLFKGASVATNAISDFAKGVNTFVTGLATASGLLGGAVGGSGGIVANFSTLAATLMGPAGVVAAVAGLGVAAFSLWSVFDDQKKAKLASRDARSMMVSTVGTEASYAARRAATLKEQLYKDGRERKDLAPEQRERLQTELSKNIKVLSDPEQLGKFLREYASAQEKIGGTDYQSIKTASSEDLAKIFGAGQYDPMLFEKMFDNTAEAKTLMGDLNTTVKMMANLPPDVWLAAQRKAWPEQFKDAVVPTETTSLKNTPDAGKPAKVNVTIQRIEVASDDPDRFVFGMVKAFEKAARNPTQAASALGGS